MNIQYKSHAIDEMSDEGIIKGYASVFGNIDSDGDTIEKGAYTKTLNENKERIKFLWQHRMDKPLGKVMDISQDDRGVPFSAKISDTALGNDAKTLIKDGVLNEFSVGFMPIKYEEKTDDKGRYDGLTIREVKLYEFSLVTLAANDQAVMTDYKSKDKPKEILNSIDIILKLNKSVETGEARRIMEYELLKHKRNLSLFLDSRSQTHLEEGEVEDHKNALNELDLFLLKEYKI
jgi:HK97 family phage prohead protease